MKFPYSMLLDFVQTDLNAEQVGDLLTMAGFELEGIEEVEGESVLDIKVVSNRGDGLSVYGLSREVLAKDPSSRRTDLATLAQARFASLLHTESLQISDDAATIQSDECNRFAVRAFEGIPGGIQAPEWMQKRLRQAGMRPISLLVDLTNYVMLELGQPLHAFDRDKLAGGRIVVRHARPGERLTTLNGQEHELSGQMMICDAERPIGVPGVMGGLDTEVSDSTTHLLLESANFRNTTVRKTRKQLGLSTEASYRFERSVDPDGVVAAIRRFTQLLQESVPGLQLSNIVDHYPGKTERERIRLRLAKADTLLGMTISDAEARDYLERLGFDVQPNGVEEYWVTPPAWRPDVVQEEDLVEELGRVHGYERIPEHLPQGTTTMGGPQGELLMVDRLREAAVRAGAVQIISHSLRDYHALDRSESDRIGPRVIASPEHAILRDSLLPSLADAAQRNGGRNLSLFEIGQVFWRTEGGYSERRSLALLLMGELTPSDRKGVESRVADFFTLKGALEAVLGAVNVTVSLQASSSDPRFHPTRQARVIVGGKDVGVIGQIHPEHALTLRLPEATFLAEVDVHDAFAGSTDELALRTVSRHPAVRRDIAVLVDRGVPYETIATAVAEAVGEVLERQWLFDEFAGAGIPEGMRSLGIALQLRKSDGTFTDEEANQVRDRAVAALAPLGATTR